MDNHLDISKTRKEYAIRELLAYGIPVADAKRLGALRQSRPEATQDKVRRIIFKMERALSDFAIAEREEQ